MRALAELGRRIGAFATAKHGGIAVMFALLLPVIVVIAVGGVQLAQVINDKKVTQDVADAAALMGAQQLNIAPTGADSRAQAYALAEIPRAVTNHATVTVTATILDAHTMKVQIDTHTPSFLGNMLPPGGFFTHALATAASASVTPLCVLVLAPTSTDQIHLLTTSNISAPACLVHSNQAITVDSGALLNGDINEAGTTASGPITPTASVGAPTKPDPFANLTWSNSCSGATADPAYDSQTTYNVSQMLHPADVYVSGGATVNLTPGIHVFCGNLNVAGNSTLNGDGVVLVFAPGKGIILNNNAIVSLNGAKTGPLAGFVIIADRQTTADFHINSNAITNITGTVYVPSAKLVVDGSLTKSLSSAWTVLAAKAFDLTGSAHITINANYLGSSVPVPYGVGNKTAPATLVN